MNLSTKLCDLTAGEYIKLTQGASILVSVSLTAATVVFALCLAAVRRWWKKRRPQLADGQGPINLGGAPRPPVVLVSDEEFRAAVRRDRETAETAGQHHIAAPPAPGDGLPPGAARIFRAVGICGEEFPPGRTCQQAPDHAGPHGPPAPENTEPGRTFPGSTHPGPACFCVECELKHW